jgi:molecular chaperone DnaK
LVEERNKLDGMIYTTEKSLREHGDKIDASDKERIEKALEGSRKALGAEDVAELKKAHDELAQEAHKLAEAMYAKASQQAAQAEAQSAAGEGEAKGKKEKEKEEDVVDADFEEVKGDKA